MFSEVVSSLREKSGYGLREVCRKTEKNPIIHKPLSPTYLSRIENGGGHNDMSRVTIDKLWAIGVALETDPLLLFVIKSGLPQIYQNHATREALFSVRVPNSDSLGYLLRSRRHELGLTLSEVEKASRLAPATFGVSAPFLSQIETDWPGVAEKVSGEKLWALGCVLGMHPLMLFCVSRRLPVRLEQFPAMFRKFSL